MLASRESLTVDYVIAAPTSNQLSGINFETFRRLARLLHAPKVGTDGTERVKRLEAQLS